MIKCSECGRGEHGNCVLKPRADGRRFRVFCECDHAAATTTVTLTLGGATVTVTGPAEAVAAVESDLRGLGAE